MLLSQSELFLNYSRLFQHVCAHFIKFVYETVWEGGLCLYLLGNVKVNVYSAMKYRPMKNVLREGMSHLTHHISHGANVYVLDWSTVFIIRIWH